MCLFRRQRQENNEFEASPSKVNETLSQKQYKQKGWGHGSSGRVLA
jgi:hypothetical protein